MSQENNSENSASDDPQAERPTNVRWMIFGLGCGTSWFLYLHRYTFGLIKPFLTEEFGLEKDELGWLDFAFSITYSLGQVPAGLLGDLLGAHLFLGVIIIAWSAALALHALAPESRMLYPARVFFGAAQAGCYSTLSKVSKTWFPRSVRTTLQGWIASFFGRMGGAMSNLIFAALLIGYFTMDWRSAIYVLAIGGALYGLLFALTYRNSPREHPRTNLAEARLIEGEDALQTEGRGKAPRRLTFRQMFAGMSGRSVGNFIVFLVQQFTSAFADAIYQAWVPFFLWEEHGLKFTEMGILASLPLFGGAVGGAVGGFLNDLLILKMNRRWARTLVGFHGKLLACLLIFVALWNYQDPYAFCIILFFVKFFSDWSQPTVWGTVTDIGGTATATVFGFMNMVGGFGGNLSPVVFGYVAKYASWTVVFTVVAGAYLISSVSWLFVDCTIPLMSEEPND